MAYRRGMVPPMSVNVDSIAPQMESALLEVAEQCQREHEERRTTAKELTRSTTEAADKLLYMFHAARHDEGVALLQHIKETLTDAISPKRNTREVIMSSKQLTAVANSVHEFAQHLDPSFEYQRDQLNLFGVRLEECSYQTAQVERVEVELALVTAKVGPLPSNIVNGNKPVNSVQSFSSSSFGSSIPDPSVSKDEEPKDEYSILQQEILQDLEDPDTEGLPERVSLDLDRVSTEFGSHKTSRTFDAPPTLKQTELLLKEATEVLEKDVLEVSDDDQLLECETHHNSGIGDFLKEAEKLGVNASPSMQLGGQQVHQCSVNGGWSMGGLEGRAGMFADLLEVELQKMEVNEDLVPSPTSTKL